MTILLFCLQIPRIFIPNLIIIYKLPCFTSNEKKLSLFSFDFIFRFSLKHIFITMFLLVYFFIDYVMCFFSRHLKIRNTFFVKFPHSILVNVISNVDCMFCAIVWLLNTDKTFLFFSEATRQYSGGELSLFSFWFVSIKWQLLHVLFCLSHKVLSYNVNIFTRIKFQINKQWTEKNDNYKLTKIIF